ncbi:uncharacterized protein LOC143206930 [Rhynchophorus ferrugineus]|uniref:Protein sleepless n=1 Tax=Rhynchophorus ferrugineus TaxID=354439 RepID=A0A834M070_RHYFE|nr:hypothetical protein GWI33_020898 [Rhynchophorus ferrugineus]
MYTVVIHCVILLVLFFKSGECVKCYVCSTKDNETMCRNPEWHNLELYECGHQALENTRHIAKRIDPSYDKIFEVDTSAMSKHLDLDCLKVVTKVGNKEYIFRGCQLAEQKSLDICVKMKKADTNYLKKTHCSRCSTDGCNSVTRSFVSTMCLFLSFLLQIYRCF